MIYHISTPESFNSGGETWFPDEMFPIKPIHWPISSSKEPPKPGHVTRASSHRPAAKSPRHWGKKSRFALGIRLVVSTPLKIIRQLRLWFPTYGKIKYVPNCSKPPTRNIWRFPVIRLLLSVKTGEFNLPMCSTEIRGVSRIMLFNGLVSIKTGEFCENWGTKGTCVSLKWLRVFLKLRFLFRNKIYL